MRRFLPGGSDKPAQTGTASHAQEDRREDRKEVPPTVPVCKKPDDIGRYTTVISGSDSKSIVHLEPRDTAHIAVVRVDTKTAKIVASTDIYGTSQSQRLFSAVRERLAPHKIELEGMVWAIPGLVLQLSKLQNVVTHQADSAEEHTESGAESWERFCEWVDYGVRMRASDIHIDVRRENTLIRYRIDGELERMENDHEGQYLSVHARHSVAFVFNKKTVKKSTSGGEYQRSKQMYSMVEYDIGSQVVRLRCQQNVTINGLDLIIRIVPAARKYTFEELGYAPSQIKMFYDALELGSGIIMVSGVTGSGKTTLIDTMYDCMPDRDKKKLVRMDDPTETEQEGVSHISFQSDVKDQKQRMADFGEQITGQLRGDPDAVSIGEVRDQATGNAVLTVSQTGLLAFGTTHVGSAIGIMERLTSPAIGLDLHSMTEEGTISLFVCQRLMPLLCEHCKIPLADAPLPTQERLKRASAKFLVDVSKVHFRRLEGCPHCREKGIKGRTAVAEVMDLDEQMLQYFRQRDSFKVAAHWASKGDGRFDTENMVGKLLFHHAFYKMLQGIIDPAEVERVKTFEKFIINKSQGARAA